MERTCNDCGYTGGNFEPMDACGIDYAGERRRRIVGHACPQCGSF